MKWLDSASELAKAIALRKRPPDLGIISCQFYAKLTSKSEISDLLTYYFCLHMFDRLLILDIQFYPAVVYMYIY